MIRKHLPKDLDQLMDVWKDASTLAHPFLDDKFVAMVTNAMQTQYMPNSNTWVFEEKEQIIGFISMMENEIGGLFVSTKYHGKGIGTQLVNFIKERFPVLEVEVFEKNKIGRSFYSKYGFHQIDTYFHEPSQEQVLRLKFE